MNLSAFLEISDVKNVLRTQFQKPAFSFSNGIKAAPLSKSYGLTGTAFDYLFRFYLAKINPCSVTTIWGAELALFSRALATAPAKRIATDMVNSAKALCQRYLEQKTCEPDSKLLTAVIQLARLETVYRTGRLHPETFGEADPMVLKDLENLFQAIEPDRFVAKRVCLLNPHFGSASKLVGHADADLIIDNALMDVKTNKDPLFDRTTFHQLLGYYSLFELGEVAGAPKNHRIDTLGVYFARYGVLFSFAVEPIIKNTDFVTWFKNRALQAKSEEERRHKPT